jgi:hypothetical protein
MRCLTPGLLAAIQLTVALGAASAVTLRQEPPASGLSSGETVLVDDGSCPAGQIKQLTGGSAGQPLQRKCIDESTSTNENLKRDNMNRDTVSERFAVGGKLSIFGRFYSMNPDCTSMRQDVTILKSPENGAAQLKATTTITSYSAPNVRVRCNGKSVKATALEYTPTKGYTGKDSIEVETISESGQRNTYTYDITVK